MEDPNAEWGDEYEEFAIAITLENGEEKLIFGPFTSFYHARESLAALNGWEQYKDKELYLVKRTVKPWKRY